MLVPRRIYITKRAQGHPLTEQVIGRAQGLRPGLPVDVIEASAPVDHPEGFQRKDELILDVNPGRFVRKCPGTVKAWCCNYYTIDLAEGCPMDCSYCFLRTYKPFATPVLFVNTGELERELHETLTRHPRLRLGSGELSDSFALAGFFNYNLRLIELFAAHPDSILELKTKRSVADLLPEQGRRNVVISWTLNSRSIAKEEIGAAPMEERIGCAARLCRRGYTVAFHFDPLVLYDGCRQEYR